MRAWTAWRRLLPGSVVVDEGRWVMVDVEASGLDPQRGALLAIAAIGVQVDWADMRIRVGIQDSFEVVLRQQKTSSRDNILLHGIGVQMQQDGLEPSSAMRAFADFVARSPLLAFHAAFDQALIDRYARTYMGVELPNPWVDVEHLCAATHSQVRARTLDDWMVHFGITCAIRHQAAADTWAECEVLQQIWAKIVQEKCACWKDVASLARRQRWLSRA